MLQTLIWLLGFQLAGEGLSRLLGLPVPGPVLGMLLLFLALCLRRGAPEGLQRQVPRLLSHLSLLFIPAGAALLAYRGLLAEYGARLALVLAVSCVLTLLVPAAVLHGWQRARRKK